MIIPKCSKCGKELKCEENFVVCSGCGKVVCEGCMEKEDRKIN